MLEFVEREGLIDRVEPVQFTLRLLVPPGPSLLTRDAIKPHLGPLDQASLSYRWTHPDPGMDRLQQEASHLVEAAAKAEEDSGVTFYRLRDLAYARLGVPAPVPSALPPDRRRPSRSWRKGSLRGSAALRRAGSGGGTAPALSNSSAGLGSGLGGPTLDFRRAASR